jgi:hypothetical protein
MKPDSLLKLTPGRFYLDREGSTWCCYGVDRRNASHFQAFCVRVTPLSASPRTEYFFIDGRYDSRGLRELCLIKEVEAPK